MSGAGDTLTLPEDDALAVRDGVSSQIALALVIAWSAHEPARVGEIALLPAEAQPRVIGRGHERTADAGPRAIFVRQRPSSMLPTGSLRSPRISRVQLQVRALDTSVLEVTNVGKCMLEQNDTPVDRALVRAGDVLQLGRQLLLLCVSRPLLLPGSMPYPVSEFGGPDPYEIVGESPASWVMRQQLAFVGRRSGHVLLRGASGTGKELAARAIHRLSNRGEKPLVSRSAATLPETLIDAELFGNRREYPNPGMPERPGLIGQAHETTLFLDEIGELPESLQAHLLRVLDQGEYSRLGDSTARRSDFRLIAATNRSESSIKPDLLARFAFRLDLPDLNARREDVPLLARELVLRMARSDPEFGERFVEDGTPHIGIDLSKQLLRHAYQLNVREIERLLSKSALESRGPSLEGVHSERNAKHDQAESADRDALGSSREQSRLGPVEIQTALDRNNGSLERTWRALRLKNRFVLMRLIEKHGLEVKRRRPGRSGGASGTC